MSYNKSNENVLSRDIRVKVLIEIVERYTFKSLVAPVEFEIDRSQFGCHPEEVSDLFLCRIAKERYYGLFCKIKNNDETLSTLISTIDWCLDAVVLERHNITFGEIFKKLEIK